MKRMFLPLSMALAGFAIGHAAQQDDPNRGWGPGAPSVALYRQSSEVTFTGKVTGTMDAPIGPSTASGTTVVVRAKNGGIETVELGPTWYVSHLQRPLRIGDTITVTGSKAQIDNGVLILARKVTRGKHALYLRSMTGSPMWIASRGKVEGQIVASNQTSANGTIQNPATPPMNAGTGSQAGQSGQNAQNPPAPNGTVTAPDGTTMTVQSQPPDITGTVRSVETITPPGGVPIQILHMATAAGTNYNVNLGPQWYWLNQPAVFQPGLPVTFIGSNSLEQIVPGLPIYATSQAIVRGEIFSVGSSVIPNWLSPMR